MSDEPILAWHFAATQMRDGRELAAPGGVETWDGEIIPCKLGLHASERIMDALTWATGTLLRRVEVWGDVQRHGDDKIVGRYRHVLWEADMTHALRLFARQCALDVRDLWDMPDVVYEFLVTGNESIRVAAWDAARASAAAADAARASAAAADAAWSAAWDSVADAAWSAAWESIAAPARAAAYAGVAARAGAREKQEELLVSYAHAARCGLFIGSAS